MSDLSIGARLLGLKGEPLVLASRSPRRIALLDMLGLRFEVVVPDGPEGWDGATRPDRYVEALARAKAVSVRAPGGAHAVLAADTIVHLDDEVLEKPRDAEHARALLLRLSGVWHEVLTGICLRRLGDERIVTDHERSRVRFSVLEPDAIDLYVETGEPLDKAGAYGIQGYGGLLVDRIEGCYFNVMGLPLSCLRRLTRRLEAD
jgi:septum formation protein